MLSATRTHKTKFLSILQQIFQIHTTTQQSQFPHSTPTTAEEHEESKYTHLLKKCTHTSNTIHREAIHAKLIKKSFISLYVHNHLLIMYTKCGYTFKAKQLFDEMPQRNVVSWTCIISGFVQSGYCKEGVFMFLEMHKSGEKPNEFTFVSVLNGCSLIEEGLGLGLRLGFQVFGLIVRVGFESNVFLTNAFLTALIRNGELVEAVRVFENCLCKDIVSWNTMIGGYLQYSYVDIPDIWCRMNREGVKPDNFTFASVLTGFGAICDINMGLQAHAQLVKTGYGDEICVGNALVDMYLKNRKLVEGLKAFDEMPYRDVATWTEMASGCLQCGEPKKALEIFEEMKNVGVRPNKFTLATALNACANLGCLEEGRKAHSMRIKLGDEVDNCVDNALLDMYAKCGSIDAAWDVFRLMEDRSVVSWTTMIMGFAQNGRAKEALNVFSQMISENVKPNHVTFICVLYACCEGGFTEEAWEFLSSMKCDYGISPGEDHYACMVNLLGRAGQIKEAEDLVNSMPFRPGVLVWQTLLGACRIHGDLEAGKQAAQQALALDKEDPSTYILLSNMLAETSNWDDVGKLRDLMETTYVKKTPGTSWIELGGNG